MTSTLPILRPIVLVTIGPTAGAVSSLARQRLRRIVGGLPPFFAGAEFVVDHEGLGHRVWIGDGAPEDGRTLLAGQRAADVAWPWVRHALTRATDMGTNLDHGVWKRHRNALDHLEVVFVAFADELEDLRPVLELAHAVREEWGDTRRLLVLWSRIFDDRPLDEHRQRRALVRAQLEALDEAQRGGPSRDGSLSPFHGCVVLDSPIDGALCSITRDDAIGHTAGFLSTMIGSSAGSELRQEFHPQPRPARFRIGFAARHHDPDEVHEHLRAIWMGECARVLLSAEGTVPVALLVTMGLSVKGIGAADDEDVDRHIADHSDHVIAELARAGRSPEGALVRVRAVLEKHLEDLHALRSVWLREEDQRHREHEALRRRGAPDPSILSEVEGEPVQSYRWWIVAATALLSVLGLTIAESGLRTSGDLMVPMFGGLAATIVALIIVALTPVERRRTEKRSRPNPEYETHHRSLEKLEAAMKQARRIVGEPFPGGTDPETSEDPAATGLWGLIVRLERKYQDVIRAGVELERSARRTRTDHGWFLRNITSVADLERLFERALILPGTRIIPVPDRRRLVVERIHAVLADGVQPLLERDASHFVSLLADHAEVLFGRIRGFGVDELLDWFAEGQESGVDGRSEFFNSLAQAATVLWPRDPHLVTRAATFVVFSPPWKSATVRHAERILGACQVFESEGIGEVVVVRVEREELARTSSSRSTTHQTPAGDGQLRSPESSGSLSP